MKLNDLRPAKGSTKAKRRVGRGTGSGTGKTAGRGQKGQKSRSGFSKSPGWEGGRSRLIMRLPKRGINNARYRLAYQVINLDDLNRFDDGASVDNDSLKAQGLIKNFRKPVKLLANGELTTKGLKLSLDAYSKAAISAVEAAGGSVLIAESDGVE